MDGLYEKAMKKALSLLDSEAIIFYQKYKWSLQTKDDQKRFQSTYRTTERGRELKLGRYLQLLLFYDRDGCPSLAPLFINGFSSILQDVEHYPEMLFQEDMNIFPEITRRMVTERIFRDMFHLIDVHIDNLMRNRMDLDIDKLKKIYQQDWTRYFASNKDKCAKYLEKLYDAQMCLAAAEHDAEEFVYWLLRCGEMEEELEIKFSESLQKRIKKYDGWLSSNDSEGDQEDSILRPDTATISKTQALSKIREDFENQYISPPLHTTVDDFECWLETRCLPKELKDRLSDEALMESDYWYYFLEDEESLEFLISLMQETQELSMSVTGASAQVVQYISDCCAIRKQDLEFLLSKLYFSENERNLFSKEELNHLYLELSDGEDDLTE